MKIKKSELLEKLERVISEINKDELVKLKNIVNDKCIHYMDMKSRVHLYERP